MRKSPEDWLELLKKWLPKACGFRYLHFPIHKGHHWTLLVLDTEWRSWKFHNSCLRTGVDHYCEVAEQLKKQVQNYWKSTLDGLVTILDDWQPIELSMECQQKGRSSLDCGIILCYIIRQSYRNEPILRNLSNTECQQLRADMAHEFLSDEENSWSLEKQLEDEIKTVQ